MYPSTYHPGTAFKIDLGGGWLVGCNDWCLSNECAFHPQSSKTPEGDTFWVSSSISLLKDCENFHSIRAQGTLYSWPAAKYSKANLRVWEQLHGNLSTHFSGCIRLLCGSRFFRTLKIRNCLFFIVRSTSSMHWFIDYQRDVSDRSIIICLFTTVMCWQPDEWQALQQIIKKLL